MRLLLLLPAAAVLLVAVLGCERPTPRLVCHNGNCVEPTDPEADDTLAALEESLALIDDEDVPVIDGIELDIFWRGADDTCIYAHDLSGEGEVPSPSEPVARIADYLATRTAAGAAVTHDGGPFIVFMELKPHVGEAKTDKHSAEQLVAHASCALDVVDELAAAAVAADTSLAITITSFEPALLSAVTENPRYDRTPATGVTLGLGAIKGTPPPLDSQSLPIRSFGDVPLTTVTAHPHWLRRSELLALRQRGIEIGYWMFQAVPETLAAIERDDPEYVTTSEANLLRRWLDR